MLKKLILAGVLLTPIFFAQPAEAREYCREFQKEIRVGNRWESGYGTACMQPDGAWLITSSRGNVDPFDDLRRDRDVIIVSDQRPVYYNYGQYARPVTYYPRTHYRNHYYQTPGLYISFNDRDNRWDRHDRRDNRNWGRNDRNDRHDNDRGRGHNNGRGRGHDRD